ncbi:CII family transcriptional regulator [Staphylococcus aureus]
MVRANKRNEALRIESALLNKIAMLGTEKTAEAVGVDKSQICLLYTSPSPRDTERSRMPSSA